jgi:4'-phosphopantetheinyl transferase
VHLRQIHAKLGDNLRLVGTTRTSCTTPTLYRGEVHLWWVDLEQHRHLLDACQELLDPQENQRKAAFHEPAQKSDFILQRGILRFLLGSYLGLALDSLQLEQSETGKLSVHIGNQLELNFNLSHSGQMALYAFCRQTALGVDIQQVRPMEDLWALARRVLSRIELEHFQAEMDHQQQSWFFRAWVRKEACLKAWGSGFQTEPGTISILAAEQRPNTLVIYRQEKPDPEWRVVDLIAPQGYEAALCWQVVKR